MKNEQELQWRGMIHDHHAKNLELSLILEKEQI